jgi:transcriptional regulator with XRE-family HTH domain
MNQPNEENEIRKLYLKSGLTYDELAEITGIKRNTIASWIIGRRTPPEYTIAFVREKVEKELETRKQIRRV